MNGRLMRLVKGAVPVLVMLTAAHASSSQLQTLPLAIPIAPWPGDHIIVGTLESSCLSLDPVRLPVAKQLSHIPALNGNPEEDQYVHEVRYWTVSVDFCNSPPDTFEYRVDIGPLPPGSHELLVTRVDELVQQPVESVTLEVRERSFLPPDVTGPWYAPEQSGRGAIVAKRGQFVSVWWSTHDAHGQPIWLLMADPYSGGAPGSAVAEGEAFNTTGTPLKPGPAQLSSQRWGELRFRYRGCGRASLEWQADDPAIGEGQVNLVQLMLPDDITPCSPRHGVEVVHAIWEE